MRSRTLFLALLASIAVTACGDRHEAQASLDRSYAPASAPAEAKVDAVASTNGFMQRDEAPAHDPAASGGPRALGDTASLPTMLIRTGQAEVRVDSLEPAIAALEALARRAGGYVGNTSFLGGEENRRAA